MENEQKSEETPAEERARLEKRLRELVKDPSVQEELLKLYTDDRHGLNGLRHSVKGLELSAKIKEEKRLNGETEPTDWGCLGVVFGVFFSIGFILTGSWIMWRIPSWIGHPQNPMPHFVIAWLPFALGRAALQGARNANPQSNAQIYWWVMGITSLAVWACLHFLS